MDHQDGNRQQHQRKDVRTFSVGLQNLHSAGKPASTHIRPDFPDQDRRNVHDGVEQAPRETGQHAFRETRRQEESSHRSEAIFASGNEVIGTRRAPSGEAHGPLRKPHQTRWIRVVQGFPAIPKRKPGERVAVMREVVRQRDVSALDGSHVVGVLQVEEGPANRGVDREQDNASREHRESAL